jgi:hypothetical protein
MANHGIGTPRSHTLLRIHGTLLDHPKLISRSHPRERWRSAPHCATAPTARAGAGSSVVALPLASADTAQYPGMRDRRPRVSCVSSECSTGSQEMMGGREMGADCGLRHTLPFHPPTASLLCNTVPMQAADMGSRLRLPCFYSLSLPTGHCTVQRRCAPVHTSASSDSPLAVGTESAAAHLSLPRPRPPPRHTLVPTGPAHHAGPPPPPPHACPRGSDIQNAPRRRGHHPPPPRRLPSPRTNL